MSTLELLGPDQHPTATDAERVVWPPPSQVGDLRTGLDWRLSQYGVVHRAAADLLHIAAAAYVADRRTRRPIGFARNLDLLVHVSDPHIWAGGAGERLVDLLNWLSGDVWSLTPVQGKGSDEGSELSASPPRQETMLLSGGLDSFCGAVARLSTAKSRLHIGHRDAATSVQHAQKQVRAWMAGQVKEFSWLSHELREAAGKVENTTRTRSLLFMTMAIAAATGCGADCVVVPENGFTSMNLPLVPSRGGALSTKSTHPHTFDQLNALVAEAGIGVVVENPYIGLTKGEFLTKAASGAPGTFLDATKDTLSCAKLDSGRFAKGSPNLNCGLCYACFVRRGAYISAGLTDPTEYLLDRLTGDSRRALIEKRRDDIWAITYSARQPAPTIDDLIATASWPETTDLDAILDLVRRGRQELHNVPLP